MLPGRQKSWTEPSWPALEIRFFLSVNHLQLDAVRRFLLCHKTQQSQSQTLPHAFIWVNTWRLVHEAFAWKKYINIFLMFFYNMLSFLWCVRIRVYVFSFDCRLLFWWREPFLFLHVCLVVPLLSPSCLYLLHFGVPPSTFSSCPPLQPTQLPSRRKRALASVWSAQGGSVCTQCLPSWANSSAAAVWAKPGALIVTNAPLQEQVRLQVLQGLHASRLFFPICMGQTLLWLSSTGMPFKHPCQVCPLTQQLVELSLKRKKFSFLHTDWSVALDFGDHKHLSPLADA